MKVTGAIVRSRRASTILRLSVHVLLITVVANGTFLIELFELVLVVVIIYCVGCSLISIKNDFFLSALIIVVPTLEST